MRRTWGGWAKTALAAGIALALVAGCGRSGPAGSAGQEGGNGGKVELSFDYPVGVAGPLSRIVQGMVDEFNRTHPNIHVTASFTGSYADTTTKVVTAVRAHNPPDVAILLSTDMQTLIDLDAIVPVDDLLAEKDTDSAFDLKDFYPALLKNSQQNGKTWGVPFQRSTPVLYYNKTAMKEAGLDPERPPQTWAELVEDAHKVQREDGNGQVTRWGVEFPATGTAYWMFQGLAIEAGQDLNGPDPSHVNVATPAAKKALQWLLDLSKKEKVMPEGTIDWAAVPTDFASGKTVFAYHSTGSLSAILNQAKFDVGVAYMPKDVQFGVPTGGGNFYIFKGIPESHRKAAWVFVQWMTAPERAAQWAIDTGYVPVRQSAVRTQRWKAYIEKTPQAKVAIDQMQYAYAEFTGHQSAQLQKAVSDAVQAALTGRKTPGQALDDAQKQADQILASYR